MTRFKTTALAGYLMLLVFSTLMRAEEAAAPSTLSAIHFRSPRGFSIVVPVYVNGSGPFEFLLDTGATVTVVDPELLKSLRLDVTGDGTNTTLTGKTTILFAVARTVSVGPVTENNVQLGVRDLVGLRELDSKIHGVLGQNVLKNADFLIDNRKRTIKFDVAGALLTALDGERVYTNRIATPEDPSYGGTAVPVKLAGSNAYDGNFLLDSGSASVVLFSDSLDLGRMPKESRSLTLEDDDGRRKYVSAYPMQLRVGSTNRDVDVYVTAVGSKGLAVVGLLPTSVFDSLYISNSGAFVIFHPKRNLGESVAAINRKAASVPQCQHNALEVDGN